MPRQSGTELEKLERKVRLKLQALRGSRATEVIELSYSDEIQVRRDQSFDDSTNPPTTITARAASRHFQPYQIPLSEFPLDSVSAADSYPSCRTYLAKLRAPGESLRESNIGIWTFHCPPVWESVGTR